MDRAIGGILQLKQTVSNTEMPKLSLVRQPTPNLKWLALRNPLPRSQRISLLEMLLSLL
jgi:hypothetical protein